MLLTGASRGIGQAIALALAREQATVVGVARSKERLNQIENKIKAIAGKGAVVPFDIRNTTELPLLVQEVRERVGPIDILINNAGVEKYRAFQDYSLEDIQTILATNLIAAMELARLVLPSMVRTRSGHLVNIASLAGKKGAPFNSIYSASKAGLIMWTDALRQELKGTGVAVSLISPGYVQAGIFAKPPLPMPSFSKACPPARVAAAVNRAIRHNKADVIVNGGLARLLFAVGQFFPRVLDVFYLWLGITEYNRRLARNENDSTSNSTK